MAIAEYRNCLRKKLEDLSAASRSRAISSAPSINHHRHLREGLKTQPESIASNSFVSGSNISDPTSAAAEPPKADFALWQEHCRRSRIKDLTPSACSLSEFT